MGGSIIGQTYEERRDAEEAVKKLDGQTLDGERIIVEHAGRSSSLAAGQRKSGRDSTRGRGPQPDDKCFKCGKTGHWYAEPLARS